MRSKKCICVIKGKENAARVFEGLRISQSKLTSTKNQMWISKNDFNTLDSTDIPVAVFGTPLESKLTVSTKTAQENLSLHPEKNTTF